MSHIDIENFPDNWKNADISAFDNISDNFLKLLAKFRSPDKKTQLKVQQCVKNAQNLFKKVQSCHGQKAKKGNCFHISL